MASHGLRLSTPGGAARIVVGGVLSVAMLVRPATPTDVPRLLGFIQELAEYEREPDAVNADIDSLQSVLFAERPHVFAHVV